MNGARTAGFGVRAARRRRSAPDSLRWGAGARTMPPALGGARDLSNLGTVADADDSAVKIR